MVTTPEYAICAQLISRENCWIFTPTYFWLSIGEGDPLPNIPSIGHCRAIRSSAYGITGAESRRPISLGRQELQGRVSVYEARIDGDLPLVWTLTFASSHARWNSASQGSSLSVSQRFWVDPTVRFATQISFKEAKVPFGVANLACIRATKRRTSPSIWSGRNLT